MNHPSNRRTKRMTTAITLFVWLFGVASGIANACSLEEMRGTHAHSLVTGVEESPHSHRIVERSAQATDIDDDINASPTFKALCLDACDERTNTLPKQDASLDPPLLAPLGVIAIVWIENQPIVATVRLNRDNHDDPFGIPIRVRYSRLTL